MCLIGSAWCQSELDAYRATGTYALHQFSHLYDERVVAFEVFNGPPLYAYVYAVPAWFAELIHPGHLGLVWLFTFPALIASVITTLVLFRHSDSVIPAAAFFLCPLTMLADTVVGAPDALMVPMVLASCLALERGRHRIAGVWIGLAISIKIIPVVIVAIVVIRLIQERAWRECRAYMTGAAIVCLVIALPFLMLHPLDFIHRALLQQHHRLGPHMTLSAIVCWALGLNANNYPPELSVPLIVGLQCILPVAMIWFAVRTTRVRLSLRNQFALTLVAYYASTFWLTAFHTLYLLPFLCLMLPTRRSVFWMAWGYVATVFVFVELQANPSYSLFGHNPQLFDGVGRQQMFGFFALTNVLLWLGLFRAFDRTACAPQRTSRLASPL